MALFKRVIMLEINLDMIGELEYDFIKKNYIRQ